MKRKSRSVKDRPSEERDERLLETIVEDSCKAAAMAEDDWLALSQFPLAPLAIPVPVGGEYRVTQAGVNAAHKLTEKVWKKQRGYRKTIDRKAFDRLSFRAIGQSIHAGFAQLFEELGDAAGSVELDQAFYSKLAVDYKQNLDMFAEEVRLDVDQHIPCTMFHEDQKVPAFSVGPVEFLPRANWIERFIREGSIRDLVNQVERRERTIDDVSREALKKDGGRTARNALAALRFLDGFACVGTIRAAGHEPTHSHRKMSTIVGIAIDAVGLLFHVSQARRFTRAGRAYLIAEHRLATTVDDGRFIHGWSTHMPGFGSEPGAIAKGIQEERSFLDAAGQILKAFMANSQIDGLRYLVEAWVNALYWFGEARREVSGFMRVVKYGCSIDVLSGAGGKIKEIISFAEAGLVSGKTDDAQDVKLSVAQAVKMVYQKGRNKLAHGESPGVLENFTEQQMIGDLLLASLFYVVTLELGEILADDACRKSEIRKEHAFRLLKERLRNQD